MTITLNLVEILVVVVVNFVLGFVWYSMAVFGKPWTQEVGLSESEVKAGPGGAGFVMVAIASAITAIVMATLFSYLQPATLTDTLIWGLLLGIGFIGSAFASNYVFEKRSRLLLALDAGYWIVSTVLVALVVFLIQ